MEGRGLQCRRQVTNFRRADERLCLSALHDRAFDQGLITVLPDYTVRVSPALRAQTGDAFMADALSRYDGARITLPERFAPAPGFLHWHASRFGFITQ